MFISSLSGSGKPSGSGSGSGSGSEPARYKPIIAFIDGYGNGFDRTSLKTQITNIKTLYPNTKVLASVGGGSAGDWSSAYDLSALKRFVEETGVSGFDLDYEPPTAWSPDSSVAKKYLKMTQDFRSILPVGNKLLTTAVWASGVSTGNAIPALQSGLFDYVNIMTYDSGEINYFDYSGAIDQFAKYVDVSKILVGIESPIEGWGNHVTSIEEAKFAANAVLSKKAAGLFTWYFNKNDSSPTETQLRAAVKDVLKV
ncbi:glycoside hydrolase family 18 protein [Gonapodya prolifera JEL478]|uniref:Glycoside hydrolase family 18 protein n=1 Tax=Gonapodya prolifera (strain JEL478) TaxID=1344416 RepID=A0A138ZWY9_GONPJ|nr:glycoside hydrolase family 18 protein [Gonapodya prolifera JEL478]|eukprot:KXS08974.1 glycoside hydrolase family 18 protein [Gonapodya prolifera JEL478]